MELATLFADALLKSALAGNAAIARLCPESKAACLEIPGGYAFFNGVKNAATQALIVRSPGFVTEDKINEMETFFRKRGGKVSIFIVDESGAQDLLILLEGRGYQKEVVLRTFWRGLPAANAPAPADGVEIVRVDASDPAQLNNWARSSAAGFRERHEAITDLEIEGWELCHWSARSSVNNWQMFGAIRAGELAGSAMLRTDGAVALLRSASTRFNHRGRGVQSSLIAHRLRVASQVGCKAAFAIAEAEGVSERNLRKFGFMILQQGGTYSLP